MFKLKDHARPEGVSATVPERKWADKVEEIHAAGTTINIFIVHNFYITRRYTTPDKKTMCSRKRETRKYRHCVGGDIEHACMYST